jgi:hypothetical protein
MNSSTKSLHNIQPRHKAYQRAFDSAMVCAHSSAARQQFNAAGAAAIRQAVAAGMAKLAQWTHLPRTSATGV